MTYKQKLIDACKIINKYVEKNTKGMVCFNESDIMEIEMEWSGGICQNIFKHVQKLLESHELIYDTQLSPWCLKQNLRGSAVSRDRFFSCKGCKYAKRHKLCCCDKGNTYEKVLNRIRYCKAEHLKIYELPGLLEELKNEIFINND